MSQDQDPDRWFDVLTGKADPTDDDTRQAAQLRRALLQRRQQELDAPTDEAQTKRIMNALEARGAFKPPAAPAAPPSLLSRAAQWLFPSGGQPRGHGGRYAWVAAAVLAVVAAPLVLRQQAPDDGDGYTTKSLPPERPASAASASIVSTRNIEAEAARIENALAQHGVKPTRAVVNQQLVLSAQVPADRIEAVNRELADWAVMVPPDGKLLVMLVASPPQP